MAAAKTRAHPPIPQHVRLRQADQGDERQSGNGAVGDDPMHPVRRKPAFVAARGRDFQILLKEPPADQRLAEKLLVGGVAQHIAAIVAEQRDHAVLADVERRDVAMQLLRRDGGERGAPERSVAVIETARDIDDPLVLQRTFPPLDRGLDEQAVAGSVAQRGKEGARRQVDPRPVRASPRVEMAVRPDQEQVEGARQPPPDRRQRLVDTVDRRLVCQPVGLDGLADPAQRRVDGVEVVAHMNRNRVGEVVRIAVGPVDDALAVKPHCGRRRPPK